jgi:hypothetical protein
MKQVGREVLLLVGLVVLVDALFGAAYLLGHLRAASDLAKVAFTAAWTLATLAVVVRGLSRVRKARVVR